MLSTITARALLAIASAMKLDVCALAVEAGLDPMLLEDREARLPERVGVRLWAAIERASGDPSFGLCAAALLPIGGLDLVDYACRAAATLGEALDLVLQHGRFLADSMSIVVAHESKQTRLRIELPAPSSRHGVEAMMALMVLRARQLTGEPLTPREVHFRHAGPADVTPYKKLFQSPVLFMQGHDELLFDRAALETRIPTEDPALREILVSHARTLLGDRPTSAGMVARLRRAVEEGLRTREVDLQTLARKLHLSPRTLQRRLHEAGTSHQGMVDSVRQDLALRLLESDVPIAEAAYLLGFSEASAFHRAFKRWTGETPAEFRRRRAG